MKRTNKGVMADFVRGAEIWKHQANMLFSAIKWAVLGAFLVCFASAYLAMLFSTSNVEQYYLWKNKIAHIKALSYLDKGPQTLFVGGKDSTFTNAQVIELTQDISDQTVSKLKWAIIIGLLIGVAAFASLIIYWVFYGKAKMKDEHMRGAELVDGEVLKEKVIALNEASVITLAGIPTRKGGEMLHTMVSGATGTGKSVAIFEILDTVRRLGKRAIVYDPSGEFCEAFYREGQDVLMNPLDARSPNWNVWQEIRAKYDYLNLAKGLIPDPPNADPFWAQAGRVLFEDLVARLARDGRATNKDLYEEIALTKLQEIYEHLAGTAGANYVDPTVEKTSLSVKMTVLNALNSFRYLHDTGEHFSIRKWVETEADSWLFITTKESQHDALKPIISLWLNTAIRGVMDLPPTRLPRFWLSIDELAGLQKIDSLELALTKTRKYGLCSVFGIQSFAQLRQVYGDDMAQTIIGMCQTRLVLRVSGGDTADDLAKAFGEAEVDEKDEALSYGAGTNRDGVNVQARRMLRDIVLSSEVQRLPDLAGFLSIPGDYPVARVQLEWKQRPVIAVSYIERDGYLLAPRSAHPEGSMPPTPVAPPAGDKPAKKPKPKKVKVVAKAGVEPGLHPNWEPIQEGAAGTGEEPPISIYHDL